MKKAVVLAMAVFLLPTDGGAMGDGGDSLRRWGATVGISPGRLLVVDQYQDKWQKGKDNLSLDFNVSHITLPADSDDFAADYNFPTIRAGVKWSFNHRVTMHRSPDPDWGLAEEVDYTSIMGNSVAVYGTFARPFFRKRKWTAEYALSIGVGYSHDKYNSYNAVDNELIGSRWLLYFGAGVAFGYRVADNWGVKVGLDYWHLSNAALSRPNKGANFLGPYLGLTYFPYYKYVEGRKEHRNSKIYPKSLYAFFAFGVGAKTLNEEWLRTQFNTPKGEEDYRTGHFRLYLAYSLQADLMYRYHRKWASGVGFDLFYGSYASRVEELDQLQRADCKHSPWSVGVALRHHAYYHRLAMTMSLGYYLYREMGYNANLIEKPYYEKIGMQYTLPCASQLTVGFNVKAHLTKADFMELVVALPLILTKK